MLRTEKQNNVSFLLNRMGFLVGVLVLVFTANVNTRGEEQDASDLSFLEKTTKRAVDRIDDSVVNVRPVIDWEQMPSLTTLLEEKGGDLKDFYENHKGMMKKRHKQALRKILNRLSEEQIKNILLTKFSRINRRGGWLENEIRDAIDFIQYFAPPETGFSGVLLNDGYVITSQFAVSQDYITNIHIYTAGGTKLKAEKRGGSMQFDLALLKINKNQLPDDAEPVVLSNVSESIRVGHFSISVGRGPRPKETTASRGIISASQLMVGRALQTDALSNYSNTGGALVDVNGRLIGIITGVTLENLLMVGQNSGVTRAIRPGIIKNLLPEMKSGKLIKSPFLGVQGSRSDGPERGVKIKRVLSGYAAEKAGLQGGDLIISFEGKNVYKWRDLVNGIRKRLPGDEVQLKVRRDGNVKQFTLTLSKRE